MMESESETTAEANEANSLPCVNSDGGGHHRGNVKVPVVGLGGSESFFASILEFIAAVPTNTGIAFLIACPLATTDDGMFVQRLRQISAMRVEMITAGVGFEANHAYVIPHGKILRIVDDQLRLTEATEAHEEPNTVDSLFSSLAEIYGTQSIAILLSGTGDDGFSGLERIRERGGIAIAQTSIQGQQQASTRFNIKSAGVERDLTLEEVIAALLEHVRCRNEIMVPDHCRPQLGVDIQLTKCELHFHLLEQFSPPSILVNHAHDILHCSASAKQYLQPHAKVPIPHILNAVHSSLRQELATALLMAAETQKTATASRVFFGIGENPRFIDIRVAPSRDLAPGCLLVVFDDPPENSFEQGRTKVESSEKHNCQQQDRIITSDLVAVVLDGKLWLEEFTPGAKTLLNLQSTDLGRPLNEISLPIGGSELVSDAQYSLANQQPSKRELQSGERWYISLIHPLPATADQSSRVVISFFEITEQKLAAEEIARIAADSERQRRVYETVLNNTPDFIYVFSLDHRVLYANEALVKMWGLSLQETMGKSFLEIGYEPWHAQMHEREIDQVRTTRKPIRGEVPFTGTNGRRQYEYIFVPVLGDDGEVEAVAGTTRDVTEQREAERTIIAGEERLKTALTAAQMVAWEWAPRDGKLSVSENAGEIFGLHAGVGLTNIEQGLALVHPDDIDYYRQTFQKAIDQRGSYLIRYRVLRPNDGRMIWIEERGHAVCDPFSGRLRLSGVAADVTESVSNEAERERLIQQIEGERGRLAEVFSQAPAFMCVLRGPNHVFEMANERYYSVVGRRNLIGKSVREALPEVEEQGFIDLLDNVYKTGESFVGTGVRLQLGQAEEQYVDFVYQALREANDQITGIMVVGVEVTARHKAQIELRLSEQRFRTLFETMDEGFCVVEMEFDRTGRAIDYRIVTMNPAFEKHTGMQGLCGKSIRQAIPELEEFWYETYGRVATSGEKVSFVHQASAMDGRWFEVSAFPLPGSHSTLVAILFNDITLRQKTETALRESEERSAFVRRSSGVGFWYCDLPFDVLQWDELVKSHFHLPPDAEVNIETFYARIHPDDRERTRLAIEQSIERRIHYNIDYRTVDPNTKNVRWVRAIGRTFYAADGTPIRFDGISLDVSDQKRAEESLIQAREAADAANASKSAFLANMSHEIRTPMTAILGYTDLLQDLIQEDNAIQYLQTIRNNGYYLLDIINDILDLSKIEAGKLDIDCERFEPHRLIEDIRSIMEIRAKEKGLSLEVQYLGLLPRVIESDAKRLKQILINLIGNAIKFTQHGKVQICVRFDLLTRFLQCEVIDTGIGISPNQMERLFKPFSQGDVSVSRNFGGTGLGLIISQRLAEMLGGSIVATSTEGVGSTFCVGIPVGEISDPQLIHYGEVSAKKPIHEESTAVQAATLSCHVLIVDDRRDIRMLSKHILTKAGATVAECEDGLIAVEHITECLNAGNVPDLILLDMQMPNLDGYSTARRLRTLGYRGPIVALTADAMQSDMNKCLEMGCNDYLSKPIDRVQLLNKVAELTDLPSSN